jgi:hypothetical protein
MNKKVIFSSFLVCLLALSLGFVSCDNGTSPDSGDFPNPPPPSPYVFTVQGITNAQRTEGWDLFLVGFFTPGAGNDDIISAVYVYFNDTNPPRSLIAYSGGNSVSGSDNNWSVSGTLIDCATGQNNFATDGTYDVWFVLKNGNVYQGYKLANLVVQGDTTKNASEFTKVISNYTP